MSQTLPNVDMVSIELRELWVAVEEAGRDNVFTEIEKRRLRRVYIPLQQRARRAALMQRIGLNVARTGNLDKNLVTEIRSMLEDDATIAEGGNPFDLAA